MEPCSKCEFGFDGDPGIVKITGGEHKTRRRIEKGRTIITVISRLGKEERWKARYSRRELRVAEI